ncbi:hypothetical protein [Pseudomarimonas salicorniae]|uniref:Uncharacterized protein n=1 Tax=Pseudomarimonas salicorniae TaxID=2933270 RepID=A0ABT0GM08_9GAMM|nr:hypothetical protein [Lysobacter sp. CAU 1642]MCK7595586.1 hypothetical protein [Lysobacter sp. CAU 1642]
MRHPFTCFALAFVLALSACAADAAKRKEHQNVEFSPQRFAEQRDTILESLHDETYTELTDENRSAVLAALARMEARLSGVSRFEDMDKRDQTAVFNDQELINNLLTQAAADSRLICKREKFVGSNRTTNVCLTVGERRRLAEAAQDQMRGLQGSGYLPRE